MNIRPEEADLFQADRWTDDDKADSHFSQFFKHA
jgi:hypothetical protein